MLNRDWAQILLLFGKGLRRVTLLVEISYDVGAFLRVPDAGEAHLVAGGERTRILQPLIEVVEGPFAALFFERVRIGEARFLGNVTVDYPVKVRADLVWSAFRPAMTSRALLHGILASIGVCACKQRLHRRVLLFGLC